MSLRLIEQLRAHARAFPKQPAMMPVGGDWRAVTWLELNDCVWALAARLDALVPDGGPILLCLPNGPPYTIVFLAALAAGRTIFPVPVESTGPELDGAIRRSGAAVAIVAPDHARPAGAFVGIPECGPADTLLVSLAPRPSGDQTGPGLLLQSSGTTGEPKIVYRDGRSLDAVAQNMVSACRFSSADHVLAAVPLCHSYGLEHGLLAPVFAGSCVHVSRGFDLSLVLPVLRTGGITMLPGVPFMFELLCQATEARFPTLRRVYSAGGPLPRTTFDTFRRLFGLNIGQVYGSTEVGSVTFNDPERADFDPTSVGRPMADVRVRILDPEDPENGHAQPPGEEGQVAIAAPSMLSAYLGEPAIPLIDGHFLTGDLGIVAANGSLHITGRTKLLIDVGGRKVNPGEVEAVLRQHPDVGQCVVLPMRLSETICRLKAIVTPGRPDADLSPQVLRRFARERLSGFKVPRVFEVRPALPVSPTGKVLRHRVEA